MDEIDQARASVDSSPDEVPSLSSTRKTFVTCDGRSGVDSSEVLAAVASFLKEKVFPVVGDHCLINLHWDGRDTSTLHVRSVVPDSHVLVPRAASSTSNNVAQSERTGSSLSFVCEQETATARSSASSPAHITIKEEPIDVTDELIISAHEIKQEIDVEQDDSNSADGKFGCAPQDDMVDDTDNEILNVSSVSPFAEDNKFDCFRPKPPMPTAAAGGLPGSAFPLYLPQSPMISMIPVMAFGQPQFQPYQQVTPMMLSPMPQMSMPGFPQMLPGYSHFLPPSSFGMQPLGMSMQHQSPTDPSVLMQRGNRYM